MKIMSIILMLSFGTGCIKINKSSPESTVPKENSVNIIGGSYQGKTPYLSGFVKIFTGNRNSRDIVDGDPSIANFSYPKGIATDGINLYVADNKMRIINIATKITTSLVGGSYDAVTTDGKYVYGYNSSRYTVDRIDRDGKWSSVIAGSGTAGSSDGSALQASFHYVTAMTTDGKNIYLTDSTSKTVRKVNLENGFVSTLNNSSFDRSDGITTDGKYLYLLDYGAQEIYKINLDSGERVLLLPEYTLGNATTDGTNLYFGLNDKLVKMNIKSGIITDIAGSTFGISEGNSTTAQFEYFNGIASDGKALYVVDVIDPVIRIIE